MKKFSFKKMSFFSTFDVALMGLLFACFVIISYIKSLVLKGPLNISIEFLFWIIAGLIFGPFKGAVFSIFADTFMQLIKGYIVQWMWQYAIIPPIITILSWSLYYLYRKLLNKPELKIEDDIKDQNIIQKKDALRVFLFAFGLVLLNLIIYIGFSAYFLLALNLDFQNKMYILSVYILFLVYFVFFLICAILYKKHNKEFILNFLAQVSIIFFIMFFFRWLMGSYAFVEYYKRFIGVAKNNAFYLHLMSISAKSLITIPLLSLIIIPSSSALEIMRKKYSDNRYYY